jgi:quercetin dioxygenase-like cupin family protein
MFMNGEKKSFSKGEIIDIPVNIPHYAVITSAKPMFALVQRQLLPR